MRLLFKAPTPNAAYPIKPHCMRPQGTTPNDQVAANRKVAMFGLQLVRNTAQDTSSQKLATISSVQQADRAHCHPSAARGADLLPKTVVQTSCGGLCCSNPRDRPNHAEGKWHNLSLGTRGVRTLRILRMPSLAYMAVGQNPVPPVKIPIPTKLD